MLTRAPAAEGSNRWCAKGGLQGQRKGFIFIYRFVFSGADTFLPRGSMIVVLVCCVLL